MSNRDLNHEAITEVLGYVRGGNEWNPTWIGTLDDGSQSEMHFQIRPLEDANDLRKVVKKAREIVGDYELGLKLSEAWANMNPTCMWFIYMILDEPHLILTVCIDACREVRNG